jgi:hypothetical protein
MASDACLALVGLLIRSNLWPSPAIFDYYSQYEWK